MSHYTAWIAAAGTILATLVYIARIARKVAANVDKWAGIFTTYDDLVKTTQANTQAIKDLTVQVAHLSQIESAKPPAP